MPRSDLPFGSEFSPEQVDLSFLLGLAHRHGPDWKAFEDDVRGRYFARRETSGYNKGKLANNTKLSLRAYGLIGEKDTTLSAVGKTLHGLRGGERTMHEAFARHILKHCHGMNFVQCVLDMHAAGEEIDLNKLRRWLGERGITVPRGGKHMSTLRLWLERAGVFVAGDRYRVDQARVEEILGLGMEEFETLAGLMPEQRAYLKALANMDGGGPHASNDIEKLAAATYGVPFNEKNLPKQVLYPLRDAGYIELERGTREAGRGAKPFLVTATDKLASEVAAPQIEQIDRQTRAALGPWLRRPLKEVRKELKSRDRHVRGLALEALAFKLMRLIDLTYVATRLRGSVTGGAEVDLIFESARLVFSRWQNPVQEHRPRFSRRRSQGSRAHPFPQEQRRRHGLDREDRQRSPTLRQQDHDGLQPVHRNDGRQRPRLVEARPAAIVDILTREARHAMDLKKLELQGGQ